MGLLGRPVAPLLLLLCPVLLCSALSKDADFDDMAMGQATDQTNWVDPFNMADLDDPPSPPAGPRKANLLKVPKPPEKEESLEVGQVLSLLGQISEGQKAILLALQRSNLTSNNQANFFLLHIMSKRYGSYRSVRSVNRQKSGIFDQLIP